MNNRVRFESRKYLIPANGVTGFDITGDTISCFEGNGTVIIEFDGDGHKTIFKKGMTLPQQDFKRVELINDNDFDVTLEFLIGEGDVDFFLTVIDGTVQIANEPNTRLDTTELRAGNFITKGLVTIPSNGAAVPLVPVNENRISLIIQNTDTVDALFIGDANTDAVTGQGYALAPNETITIGNEAGGFTGALYAHNRSGRIIKLSVCEVVE